MNSTTSITASTTTHTNTPPTTTAEIIPITTPKRVILRIRPILDNPYEDNNYLEYIYAFLRYCGPERWDPTTSHCKRHFDHIQPSSAIEPWHIILDMEKYNFDGSDFDQLPHEIYRVERRQTGIHFQLRDPVKYARFYSIVRQYSDRYKWAQ